MPFKPGQSGNPRGRPKRDRSEADALRAEMLRQAPEIMARLIELAKDGDVAAAQAVLGRCLPPLRTVDRPVVLPLAPDLGEAAGDVLSAVARGVLTIDEGNSMAALLASLTRIKESVELEQRIAALEVAANH